MTTLHFFTGAAAVYLLIGGIVCSVHPQLFRSSLSDLRNVDLGARNWIGKPVMGLLAFLFYCIVWPIAWTNRGKSEKKALQAAEAQLEKLRPFAQLYSAMNARVEYAGGDGSSFEKAVILLGATVLSGPRAEHDFVKQHYVGYEFRKQSVEQQNGRTYDALEFLTPEGEIKTIYFDISSYLRSAAKL